MCECEREGLGRGEAGGEGAQTQWRVAKDRWSKTGGQRRVSRKADGRDGSGLGSLRRLWLTRRTCPPCAVPAGCVLMADTADVSTTRCASGRVLMADTADLSTTRCASGRVHHALCQRDVSSTRCARTPRPHGRLRSAPCRRGRTRNPGLRVVWRGLCSTGCPVPRRLFEVQGSVRATCRFRRPVV